MSFETEEQIEAERVICARIEAAWRCKIHRFGRMNPIDAYGERNGGMCLVADIKRRSHNHDDYSTVLLSVRKHFSLMLASILYSVPGLFVVGFADGKLGWVNVAHVDCSPANVKIAGHNNPRVPNDREPCINVPIAQLKWVPPLEEKAE